ncbi:hypothetical protein CsSME_00004710 [Camellia sinensis var. sinensis]
MWQWQCHKTQRQVMLHVDKCKAILSPNLCCHDARLTNKAVIGDYVCKKP